MILLSLACSFADKGTETGTTTDSADTQDSGGTTLPTGIAVGDVVLSEMMADPGVVDGDFGEWFEVRNLTAASIDLLDFTFTDDDGDGFTVDSALTLPANGYVALGASSDQAVNGGAPISFAYSIDALKLGNEGDTLTMSLAGVVLDAVVYDAVSFPLIEGASLTLGAAGMTPAANDTASNWCQGQTAYGMGDLGTPAAANDPC